MKKVMIALVILIVLLMVQSCAVVKHVSPDGSSTVYRRLGNQNIGRLAIIDQATGKVIQLEGQSSLNDEFIEKMTTGIVNGLIKGMTAR
jgi:hypothetical protein